MNFLMAFVSVLILTNSAFAAESMQDPNNVAKYVAINIEVRELSESGLILKEASKKLAEALDTVSENIDELSPEQLVLINSLADKVDDIAVKLNQAVNDLPNAIKRAQTPSSELLQQSLQQVKNETINPITDKLQLWLIITIAGLCVLGISFFFVSVYFAKHIGSMGSAIKDIAEGYRIIPVEQYTPKIDEQEK